MSDMDVLSCFVGLLFFFFLIFFLSVSLASGIAFQVSVTPVSRFTLLILVLMF